MLDLRHNEFELDGPRLAQSVYLPNLHMLDVTANRLDEEGEALFANASASG